MANNPMLVPERERQVGNFLVGRLLPFRAQRQVGPFTFIDHMGPSAIGPGNYFDVDQHPHIGLSTLTYLLEGEIHHRDSTGADRVITPGSVNFMTSGRGCTHTERTPDGFRQNQQHGTLHGYQIWVALPTEREEIEPRFDHVAADELPCWRDGQLDFTLVAGEGYGRTSPLPVYSPLFMVDVSAASAETDQTLTVAGELRGQIAVVVVTGAVTVETETGEREHVEAGQMLLSQADDTCCIDLQAGSRVLLFGGERLPEERFMFWNFVSSSRERIERAKEDWRAWRFPKVTGDDTYIPLPGEDGPRVGEGALPTS